MALRAVTSAAFAAVLVGLAGCGGGAPEVVPAPGVQPKDCGRFTIAVNPWVGYEANAAVVAYLAKTELQCEVVLRPEAEVESWKNMAAGKVDVILENWGHDDFKKTYIDEQKVAVEAGLTGNKGVIGWYVPPWLAKEHPDITDWNNLNKYAEEFKTSESGDKGQFLAGDPSFVTNDEALVTNLKLDYKVVY
ncbi:MAG TPA: glycine betaine ABC transporter substrate-binding protein, partial [Kineosporiaceae bacterium]|nr:glycine betaine ABC transporter substrate-binding protein [Kineosporiaceae bacterium]